MGGVRFPSSFDVTGRFPLDSKYWVESYANLSEGEIYVGLHRWTLDTGKEYVYQKTNVWIEAAGGEQGQAATITVGNVTRGETAKVTNRGTSTNAIFDIVLPKGDTGSTPAIDIGTVTSGLQPQVVNVGTSDRAILNFTLPKGDNGLDGVTGKSIWAAFADNAQGLNPSFSSTGKKYASFLQAFQQPSLSAFTVWTLISGTDGQSIWVAYSAFSTGSNPSYILNTEHKFVSFITSPTQPLLNTFTTWVLFKGADGGPAGASAYQTWLQLGNIGTEQVFLNSLKGINGSNGAAGLSAYQIWLNLGNVGTEQQFINSLGGSGVTKAYVDSGDSALQTQINAKAGIASPSLTGTPQTPTAPVGTNTTQIASTAFVLANSASSSTYVLPQASPTTLGGVKGAGTGLVGNVSVNADSSLTAPVSQATATNISTTPSPDRSTINSSTGTAGVILAASATNAGLLLPAEKGSIASSSTRLGQLANTNGLQEGTTNLYFTGARAIGSLLTGYVRALESQAIAATDSILAALGLLERKADNNSTDISNIYSVVKIGTATNPLQRPVSVGGLSNSITGLESAALGGARLTITGADCGSVGGYISSIAGNSSAHVGGGFNTTNADFAGQVGGYGSNLYASYSAIVAGNQHTLPVGANYSVIIGGTSFGAPALSETVFIPQLYIFKVGGGISISSPDGTKRKIIALANDGTLTLDGVTITGSSSSPTTGGVTAAQLAEVRDTLQVRRTITGLTFSPVLADIGGVVIFNDTGGDLSYTIPHSSQVSWPIGSVLSVMADTTKTIIIQGGTIGGTVSIEQIDGLRRVRAGGRADLWQFALNRWALSGQITNV